MILSTDSSYTSEPLSITNPIEPSSEEVYSSPPSRSSTPILSRTTSTKSIPIQFHHNISSRQKLFRRMKSIRTKVIGRSRSISAVSSVHSNGLSASSSSKVFEGDGDEEVEVLRNDLSTTTAAAVKEQELQWSHLPFERSAIKIRLCTFNFMDSLPNGDLSEFLGEINETRWKGGKWVGSKEVSTEGEEEEEKLPKYPLSSGHPYHILVVAGQECPSASGVMSGRIPRNLDGRGWTSILERNLCGVSLSDEEEGEGGVISDDSSGKKRKDSLKSTNTNLNDSSQDGSYSKGPYVLVEKERLLGMYIAVFVSAECNHLLAATSKDRCTAGLLGGRVGNKGAVGISINFAGSKIAIICAHLSAHAHNLEIRKQNVVKILSELELDSFDGKGSRTSPNLSERFDQTFFLGDLNFRLAISRLHADFVMKSRDYETALLFDQLKEVMKEKNSPFEGFQEAKITFAPTYKYDVVKKNHNKKRNSGARTPISNTIPLPELQTPLDSDNQSIKSISSSIISDLERDEPLDLEILGPSTASSNNNSTSNSIDAVKKAQVKFLTLVKANSSAMVKKLQVMQQDSSGSPRKLSGLFPPTMRPILKSSQSEMSITKSLKGEVESGGEEDGKEREGVFDTSDKQRVQSYTDRILFRSTVIVPPLSTPTPTTSSRTFGTAFVDSLKGLLIPDPSPPSLLPQVDTTHTYFDASPVLEHLPSEPIIVEEEEHKHSPLAHFFGRRNRTRSVDTFPVSPLGFNPTTTTTITTINENGLGRTRSLNTSSSSSRRNSKGIHSMVSTSPAKGRSFSVGERPVRAVTLSSISNPTSSNNNHDKTFTRSLTQRTTTNPTNSQSASVSRIKSFFQFIPFLSTTSTITSNEINKEEIRIVEVPERDKVGPKKGEIEVLKYDSVTGVERMGAYSDHRPVFLECAIGKG